jgi:hypothetical protein
VSDHHVLFFFFFFSLTHFQRALPTSKQTNSTPPRDLSAKALAHSRGHLPQPIWASNAVPRPRSARVAAAVASSHIAASKAGEAGPSQSKEPIVRPLTHVRPRPRPRPRPHVSAHDSGKYNPNIKLSKNETSRASPSVPTPRQFPTRTPNRSQATRTTRARARGEGDDGGEDEDEGVTPSEPEVVPQTPPRRQLSAAAGRPHRQTDPLSRSPRRPSRVPAISRPSSSRARLSGLAADDEKLRTEYDPDSPTRLLAKLEQSWMTRVASAQSVLPAYAYTTGRFQGPPLYLGHKRSREEEDKDEERRHIIWNPWKRAKTDTMSPFDPAPAEHGLKLGDFASGPTPASLYSSVPPFHAYPTNLLLPPPNFIQPTVLPAISHRHPIRNGHPGPSNT